MTEIISLITIGFIFGLKHAFDADHIAAVTALNMRSRSAKEGLLHGLYWGIGHTLVLLILGVAILIFGFRIPESFNVFFEATAGVMLIALGIYTFIGGDEVFVHSHPPVGLHVHRRNSLIVGVIHGLAGSAAILILIISTMQSALLGLSYIIFFGLGTIGGMSLFSLAVSKIITGKFATHTKIYINVIVGIFSIGIGGIMLGSLAQNII